MGKWGPDGRAAAACVTFDHLGEAAELQMGIWPSGTPIGHHHSVERELPAVLDMLRGRPPVTFYLETWNFEHYPDAVRSIVDAGHEVGWHGWLHEPWTRSSEAELRAAFERSLVAFDKLGIRPTAARPPGGLLGQHGLDLLREYGFTRVSLAGTTHGLQDDMPLLPFPWTAVDGCYYIPAFASLRIEEPGPDAVGPEVLLRGAEKLLEEAVANGGFVSFVFHVLWQNTPEKIAAIATLMDRLDADERIWHAPSAEVSEWMITHPADFGPVTHIDQAPAW